MQILLNLGRSKNTPPALDRCLPRGVPRWGTPQPGLTGGTWGRIPPGRDRYSPAKSEGGYPRWGPPRPGLPGWYPRWGTTLAGMGYPRGQVWQGGTPQQGWGTPLARSDRGGVPEVGYLPPPPAGVPPPVQDNRWSTWYAAVGMPLAFTQEDFLVLQNVHAFRSYMTMSRKPKCTA